MTTKKQPKAKEQPDGGVISAAEAYPLPAIEKKIGLGTTALRTARRKGLKVRRIGRRSFVLGQDLLDYLENHATVVP